MLTSAKTSQQIVVVIFKKKFFINDYIVNWGKKKTYEDLPDYNDVKITVLSAHKIQ